MALPQILQQLGGRAVSPQMGNMGQIKNMMNMVKAAQNPQAMMQMMAQQNPKMQQAMNFIQQNGGNAKSAFYKLAEQQGINPDDVLNMLK